jgi:hypothetical protein
LCHGHFFPVLCVKCWGNSACLQFFVFHIRSHLVLGVHTHARARTD